MDGAWSRSLAAAVGACEGPAPATDNTVQLGDLVEPARVRRDALVALIDLFEEEHPNQSVNEVEHASAQLARSWVQDKMVGRHPPDTFQANGGWDLLSWVLYNNRGRARLVHAADRRHRRRLGHRDPRVRSWTPCASASRIYAVPLAVHRLNTLFFNPAVFADARRAGADQRRRWTLDDLFAAGRRRCATRASPTPIALGARAVDPVAAAVREHPGRPRPTARSTGASSAGDVDAWTSAEMSAAARRSDHPALVHQRRRRALTWDQAVDLVVGGERRDDDHGRLGQGLRPDQARKDMTSVNLEAMVPTPGTDGTFVFTTDTFGLPIGVAQPERGAGELLRFFGVGGGAGHLQPHQGFDPGAAGSAGSQYAPHRRGRRCVEFQERVSSDHDPPGPRDRDPGAARLHERDHRRAVGLRRLRPRYVGDVRGNVSVVLHALQNRPDVLRASPWQP